MTIDEFPALKKFSKVVDALAEMRRYNLRVLLAVQDNSQLKHIYGEAGFKAIESTCAVRQYLSVWGLDTAEHVSRMCGKATIIEKTANGEQLIARDLITPDEVQNMPPGQQITFINGLRPGRFRTRPYWERPSMRKHATTNVFHANTPGLPITAPIQWLLGLVLRLLAGFAGPVGALAALALAIAFGGFS